MITLWGNLAFPRIGKFPENWTTYDLISPHSELIGPYWEAITVPRGCSCPARGGKAHADSPAWLPQAAAVILAPGKELHREPGRGICMPSLPVCIFPLPSLAVGKAYSFAIVMGFERSVFPLRTWVSSCGHCFEEYWVKIFFSLF